MSVLPKTNTHTHAQAYIRTHTRKASQCDSVPQEFHKTFDNTVKKNFHRKKKHKNTGRHWGVGGGGEWQVYQLIARWNVTYWLISTAVGQTFRQKTLLSFKSENTSSPSGKEAHCGFCCFACHLFTGTARVKRGEAKKQERQRQPQQWNQLNLETLSAGQTLFFAAANKTRRLHEGNRHFAQFYKYSKQVPRLPKKKKKTSSRGVNQKSANSTKDHVHHLPNHWCFLMFDAHLAVGNVPLDGSAVDAVSHGVCIVEDCI